MRCASGWACLLRGVRLEPSGCLSLLACLRLVPCACAHQHHATGNRPGGIQPGLARWQRAPAAARAARRGEEPGGCGCGAVKVQCRAAHKHAQWKAGVCASAASMHAGSTAVLHKAIAPRRAGAGHREELGAAPYRDEQQSKGGSNERACWRSVTRLCLLLLHPDPNTACLGLTGALR